MAGLFGTDGVRARINTGSMTAENMIRIALAAGKYFLDQRQDRQGDQHEQRRPLVVIGKDTRLSGYMIEAALQAGFASIGMDMRLIGPLPTPGVAYLTRTMRADLGVMISASHNPHFDNGIKLFGPDGYKLPDVVEDAISAIVSSHIPLAEPADLGRAVRMLDGVGRYVEAVKTAIPRHMRFDGMKVVVDCANGAAYRVAPEVLFELGAEVVPIAVTPDGMNINEGCGAVSPQIMSEAVVAHGADIGIAFDGDADRLILADDCGGVLDGDQCLAVIAEAMAAAGQLSGNTVVGTLMSNHGLQQWLATKDIALERANVGDRYILERMRGKNFNLGGEPSGHILMTDHATSGDAMMAALKLLAELKTSDRPASQSLRRFTALPQRLINVKGNDQSKMTDAINDAAVQSAVKDAEAKLADTGRVVIRPSGTEPLLRVMVEAEDEKQMNMICEHIAEIIETRLNA
jgi:phosphoglucosamine mutase